MLSSTSLGMAFSHFSFLTPPSPPAVFFAPRRGPFGSVHSHDAEKAAPGLKFHPALLSAHPSFLPSFQLLPWFLPVSGCRRVFMPFPALAPVMSAGAQGGPLGPRRGLSGGRRTEHLKRRSRCAVLCRTFGPSGRVGGGGGRVSLRTRTREEGTVVSWLERRPARLGGAYRNLG